MNNSEYQFKMIKSMTELNADLLVLRDALNELSLVLADLHFQLDGEARVVAENESVLILKRMGSGSDPQRF
jgi:hypothetical protein